MAFSPATGMYARMMKRPVLYYMNISPPARFALMTIKALNVDVELKIVNLMKLEHKLPEYEKINSMCRIPTLVHGDLIVRDSHAISTYMVNRYAPGNPLYPELSATRARIDQLLCFNMCTLFPANSALWGAYFQENFKMNPSLAAKVTESHRLLNTYMENTDYLAGRDLTLADYCILSTITSSNLLVPLDEDKFPRIAEWLHRCKQDEIHLLHNQPGVDALKEYMRS